MYQSLSIAAAIVILLLAYVYFRSEEQPMTADRRAVPTDSSDIQSGKADHAAGKANYHLRRNTPVCRWIHPKNRHLFVSSKEKQKSVAADPGSSYAQKAPAPRPIFEQPKQQIRGAVAGTKAEHSA